MTACFTADLHLHHSKLAGLRGFDTTGAHDAAVMAELYRLDPENDVLGSSVTSVRAASRACTSLWSN